MTTTAGFVPSKAAILSCVVLVALMLPQPTTAMGGAVYGDYAAYIRPTARQLRIFRTTGITANLEPVCTVTRSDVVTFGFDIAMLGRGSNDIAVMVTAPETQQIFMYGLNTTAGGACQLICETQNTNITSLGHSVGSQGNYFVLGSPQNGAAVYNKACAKVVEIPANKITTDDKKRLVGVALSGAFIYFNLGTTLGQYDSAAKDTLTVMTAPDGHLIANMHATNEWRLQGEVAVGLSCDASNNTCEYGFVGDAVDASSVSHTWNQVTATGVLPGQDVIVSAPRIVSAGSIAVAVRHPDKVRLVHPAGSSSTIPSPFVDIDAEYVYDSRLAPFAFVSRNQTTLVISDNRTNNLQLHGQPINGQWSTYSQVSACNTSCGTGFEHFRRQCNNPYPAFGGADCTDSADNFVGCSVYTYSWVYTNWHSCTAANSSNGKRCGSGTEQREVICRRCDGVDQADSVCISEVSAKPTDLTQDCSSYNWRNVLAYQRFCLPKGHIGNFNVSRPASFPDSSCSQEWLQETIFYANYIKGNNGVTDYNIDNSITRPTVNVSWYSRGHARLGNGYPVSLLLRCDYIEANAASFDAMTTSDLVEFARGGANLCDECAADGNEPLANANATCQPQLCLPQAVADLNDANGYTSLAWLTGSTTVAGVEVESADTTQILNMANKLGKSCTPDSYESKFPVSSVNHDQYNEIPYECQYYYDKWVAAGSNPANMDSMVCNKGGYPEHQCVGCDGTTRVFSYETFRVIQAAQDPYWYSGNVSVLGSGLTRINALASDACINWDRPYAVLSGQISQKCGCWASFGCANTASLVLDDCPNSNGVVSAKRSMHVQSNRLPLQIPTKPDHSAAPIAPTLLRNKNVRDESLMSEVRVINVKAAEVTSDAHIPNRQEEKTAGDDSSRHAFCDPMLALVHPSSMVKTCSGTPVSAVSSVNASAIQHGSDCSVPTHAKRVPITASAVAWNKILLSSGGHVILSETQFVAVEHHGSSVEWKQVSELSIGDVVVSGGKGGAPVSVQHISRTLTVEETIRGTEIGAACIDTADHTLVVNEVLVSTTEWPRDWRVSQKALSSQDKRALAGFLVNRRPAWIAAVVGVSLALVIVTIGGIIVRASSDKKSRAISAPAL